MDRLLERITILIVVISFLGSTNMSGQSVYLGLKTEANVLPIQDSNIAYWPRLQILDQHIYMPTPNGIYRKSVYTLNDTSWHLFAFENVAIQDFLKKGDVIVAITANKQDSMMIISMDNGNTYSYLDASYFQSFGVNNTIYNIAHNYPDLSKILVQHYYGLSYSSDSGQTWSTLSNYTPAYQYRFIDTHPLDTGLLYATGETGFYSSYLYHSANGGNSWTNLDAEHNNCTHTLAFHPVDTQVLILGGEGRISKSTDGGISWVSTIIDSPYIYIYKILYDPVNSQTVYATGQINGNNDTIYFLQSTDAGDTWSIFFQENLGVGETRGILDFDIYDGELIYVTATKGGYRKQIKLSNVSKLDSSPAKPTCYPNPSQGLVYLKSVDTIKQLKVLTLEGKVLMTKTVSSSEVELNLQDVCAGTYLLEVTCSDGSIHIQKLVRE